METNIKTFDISKYGLEIMPPVLYDDERIARKHRASYIERELNRHLESAERIEHYINKIGNNEAIDVGFRVYGYKDDINPRYPVYDKMDMTIYIAGMPEERSLVMIYFRERPDKVRMFRKDNNNVVVYVYVEEYNIESLISMALKVKLYYNGYISGKISRNEFENSVHSTMNIELI